MTGGSGGSPSVVVFEAPIARRVGAQLRYAGGPQLDDVRYAMSVVTATAAGPPRTSPEAAPAPWSPSRGLW